MLGFWLYMLAVDLLIPATMIGFGLLFLKRPPKKINAIFGYRSMRSMQNEDTWRFAHQHCGKVWCTAGLIMAPLSAIAVAFLYGLSTDRIGLFGGGLCLLKGKMKSPFFFTNCDTLLDVDFGDIYEYHKAHGNLVTMVCAFKHYTVPYGVVELGEDGGIAAMREKPELDFLTNTGVYVVEPRVVEEMRDGEKIGFPDVIERYRAAGEKVGVYPISESSWMDMGQLEELEKMRRKLENQQ